MSKKPEMIDGMFRGVIYKYTHKASQKPYVGKTDNEKSRKQSWNKPGSNAYAGSKIAAARKEYGVGPGIWDYTVLEEFYTDTHEELVDQMKEAEEKWIRFEDSIENGFNSSYGDGMKGRKHKPESKVLISKNHRTYQTEETKAILSERSKGHKHTAEAKAKISEKKKGVKKTAEQRKAMSEARKGIVPVAATQGAKEWVKRNGGSYWKNHPIPEEAKAHMKAAQQAKGTKVIATAPDGTETFYPTMLDAAKGCGLNVGSVASAIKTGGTTRNGFKFKKYKK